MQKLIVFLALLASPIYAQHEATVAMDVTGDGRTHTVHMPRLSKLLAKMRAKNGEEVTAASILPTDELDVDAEEVISGKKEHHDIHDIDGDFDNQEPEVTEEIDSAGNHWKPINMNAGIPKDDTWLEDVHLSVFPTSYDGDDKEIQKAAAESAEKAFRAKIDSELNHLREHTHEEKHEEEVAAPVSSTNLREHPPPQDDEESWLGWFLNGAEPGEVKEDVKHMREHIHEVVEETMKEDVKHMREHIHDVVEETVKKEIAKNMREHVH